jgi:imidazolonepropionase-like amidohydrolase
MWDRLLIDCHVATMVAARGDPLGIVTNAAIGIQDGKVVRVGKRTELAGFKAAEVVPLGGAWVTPGLVDCHTHLIFGGNRADEHALRRAGASYEQIARRAAASPRRSNDSRRVRQRAHRQRSPPASGPDGWRRDDDRDQVRLRRRHGQRNAPAQRRQGAG